MISRGATVLPAVAPLRVQGGPDINSADCTHCARSALTLAQLIMHAAKLLMLVALVAACLLGPARGG